MQLPHMDANTIKKLNRSKVRRVTWPKAWPYAATLTSACRSLYDLMMLDDASRDEAVVAVRMPLMMHFVRKPDACPTQLGLTAAQRKDFEAFTGAIPCVSLDASCETEARNPRSSVIGLWHLRMLTG